MILSKLNINNYMFIYEYEPTIEHEYNFIEGEELANGNVSV